ncbi:MAG: YfcE family phosphodiesterase [Eubacteriaceae bacterium]|nr:YfcE family phosphodiesterase [Eubacteriaceae bacterium]
MSIKHIFLASDSHGDVGGMVRAFGKALELFDDISVIMHAGDFASDSQVLAAHNLPIYAVKGNCDSPASTYALMELVDIGGQKILLVHGHKQGAKEGKKELGALALEVGACACVFGHTHKAFIGNVGGSLLINPGSINDPKTPGMGTSFGIVAIKDGMDIVGCEILEF